jgi:hypothetical protein
MKNISGGNPDCLVTEFFKLTARYLETLIYLLVRVNLITSVRGVVSGLTNMFRCLATYRQ